MHRSCLGAHAMPRLESGDRAPCNPPSTRQHPLTPATAPGSPAVPCLEYTHAHETKEEKWKEGPRVPREMENTKNRWKGPASTKKRRSRSESSERPGMHQSSTLRDLDLSRWFYLRSKRTRQQYIILAYCARHY